MGINKKIVDETLEPNHRIRDSHEVAQRNVTPAEDFNGILGGGVVTDPKTYEKVLKLIQA